MKNKNLLQINTYSRVDFNDLIKDKTKQMSEAVKILDFETLTIIRDEVAAITKGVESKK